MSTFHVGLILCCPASYIPSTYNDKKNPFSRFTAACPAHPGSLAMTPMTFAAVICGADDPCSVNTVYDPESSFTMSPWSTALPLYI